MHAEKLNLENIYTLILTNDSESEKRLKANFEELGSQADFVHTVEEARDFLLTVHYDLCLLDLEITTSNPLKFVKDVRNTISETLPIIAFSSECARDMIINCFTVKVNDIYMKPISINNLLKLLYIWRYKRLNGNNERRQG